MFKRWVTHDVLPSIRKTGAYLAPNIPLEKLQKLMESVGEQYKMLIERRDLKKLVINIVMQYFVLLKMRRVQ
jgi:prophage antirepressor-like protein